MSRDIRVLAAIVGVSAAADLLVLTALLLHVNASDGGALLLAAVVATTMIPQIVLAPVGGLLADRREAVTVLTVATAAQALIAAGLVATPPTAALLALSAAFAAANAVALPAEFALVTPAAGRTDPTRANGLIETSRYVGCAAGPALAGLLAFTGTLAPTMLATAGLLGAAALAAARLRVRRPPETPGDTEPRARDGVRVLTGDPVLRSVVGAAVAALFVVSVAITAEVVYLVDVLGVSPAVYGSVTACWMVGMAAGALGLAGRIPPRHQPWAALAALALQGVGMGGQTVWAVLPAAVAGYLIGGVGHGVKNTLVRAVMQRRVPASLHGRAAAAYNAARNAAELVATSLAGVLVAAIGARGALAVAGVVPVLAAVAGLVALRSARHGRNVPSAVAMAGPGDGTARAEA